MQLSKNMKHALNFARTYPGWHYHAKDRATVQAIQRLKQHKLIELHPAVARTFRASHRGQLIDIEA